MAVSLTLVEWVDNASICSDRRHRLLLSTLSTVCHLPVCLCGHFCSSVSHSVFFINYLLLSIIDPSISWSIYHNLYIYIITQGVTITYYLSTCPVILLQLKKAIEEQLHQSGLQVTPFTMTKVIQLYETKNSRHSSMLVGKTGSAKSVTWRTLQSALTALHHRGVPGFQLVQVGVSGVHCNLLISVLVAPSLFITDSSSMCV